MEDGDYATALTDRYHPLTAFLISRSHRGYEILAGAAQSPQQERERRERAALVVTLLAGLGAVFLLMRISAWVVPQVPAWGTGLLAACQPYFIRSSADIMSDSVFLVLFLLAVHEGLRFARTSSWGPPLIAGSAVGAAYLTRPEGLLLLLALPIYWCLYQRTQPRWASRTVAFVVLAVWLALPYVVAISVLGGEWTLTLKKQLWLATGEAPDLTRLRGAVLGLDLGGLGQVFHRWLTTSTEVLGVPALFGMVLVFWQRRRGQGLLDSQPPGSGAALLAIAAIGMVLLLLRLADALGASYISRRHVFSLVALSLPFTTLGLFHCGALLARVARRPVLQRRLGFALWIVASVVLVPKGVKEQRTNQGAEKLAGEFILEQQGAGAVVITTREKVAYYAMGNHVPILDEVPEATSFASAWVVFYRQEVEEVSLPFTPWMVRETQGVQPRLSFVRSFAGTGGEYRELQLYRWQG